MKKLILFLVMFGSLFFAGCSWDGFETITNVGNLDSEGKLIVDIPDYTGETVSYFITYNTRTTTLRTNASIYANTINVTNISNCSINQALDIYDNDSYFQAIITNTSGTLINFTPSLDTNFITTNSIVKCGDWNMNKNGAVNSFNFSINPPTNISWHIESLAMQFEDNSDWDSSTFGSRTALSRGFVVNVVDGYDKALFLIYNNAGFFLRGGEVTNIPKSPSGSFGFIVDMEFERKYGSILELIGSTGDRLVAIVQDDLSSQNVMSFVVRGHVITD